MTLTMQEQANNSVIFRSCNRKCNHNSIIKAATEQTAYESIRTALEISLFS